MRNGGTKLRRAAAALAVATGLLLATGVAYAAAGGIGLAKDDVLIKDTTTQIAPGVVEHELVTNTEKGNDQKIDYLCEIDLKGTSTTKLVAGYGANYSTDSWSLSSTTAQAAGYEKKTGEKVVAAINADFFNMATGEPMGALVQDGEVKHGANNRNYFAVTKDGDPVIRRGNVPLDDCQIALGGDVILVENGQVTSEAGTEYGKLDYSRTAIGVRADGTVVTFVTHGRLYPVSCGRTYQEIAELLADSGCVTALALDGGGSATYAARPEGSDAFAVRNSPSDGAEREVSSTLLVVSTAKPTGVFDHAVLSPNNEVYTPGSQVEFTANGADSSGAPVALPEGLTWRLSSESAHLGSIDPTTGSFTANESEGVATIELVDEDAVVGSTSIDIAAPDQITFSSDEVSLGFEAQTDLGIVVRNKGRDVHFNVGDILWTTTNEKLGTFEGNIFTSSDGETLNGNITATSRFNKDVSGTIHVIVGMLPTSVWDFEDHVDEATGQVTPAEQYYTGEGGILSTSNYGRGGKESIEIVSIDDDEPVRFGSHALKLNYDFTQCGEVTEGACIGTSEGMEIPGTPTGIGVWVYAPEGTGVTYEGKDSQAGFWLRGYVRDSAGNNMPYDFTLEPKAVVDENGNWNGQQPGIYWEGWQYLEADLTKMSAPFSIQPGMTFRLMYVYGTKMGTNTAGSIYFDNLQFVYGANVDDVDAPVVDSVTANNVELEDGAVLTDNTVTFDTLVHDIENKYTTGIDAEATRVYLDGVNVVNNDRFTYAADPDGLRTHLYDAVLPNGPHSFTITVRDGFGNETSETISFTVEGEGIPAAPSMSVLAREDSAVLGKTVSIDITADDLAAVDESMTSLRLARQFSSYQVTFNEAYEGTQSFNKITNTLTVQAKLKEGASPAGNVIATVVVDIPTTLIASDSFAYQVKAGSVIVDNAIYTYSAPETVMPVKAAFSVSCEPILVGSPATIKVVDAEGAPAAGVSIIHIADDGEKSIGVTDETGVLTTDAFSAEAATYTVYASKEGLLSFRTTISSFASQGEATGAPFAVLAPATVNPATGQNITWMTNPAAPAQSVRYKTAGGEWTVLPATSQLLTFTRGANTAVASHAIVIEGLVPGTEYVYQVGSDAAWSDEMKFKTNDGNHDGSFFLLGDIQDDDLTNVNALLGQIKAKGYDFGIQTGDAVDDATDFTHWTGITDLFAAANLGTADTLFVLGNHEYSGDADGSTAAAVYNQPVSGSGSCYSVTYGDVYVAVINYTATAGELERALAWMEQDAAASKATWKILTMHQPPYYTNPSGGNAEVHAMVPAAVDRAGIDFVFSGHDHSYARTEPMTGGKIDPESGAVYFICGSSGEKSYSITDNEEFNFAKLSGDYTGIYLGVEHTKTDMTVTVYEVDGSVMDAYTMHKPDPCEKGHTAMHYADGSLKCSVCGDAMPDYTGFAVDEATGKQMYYLNGAYKTGWFTYVDTMLHFGPDGLMHDVSVNENPTTCTKQGATVYACSCGAIYTVNDVKPSGHEYVEQEDGSFVCSVCDWKRIELEDCTITLPYQKYNYTGTERRPYPTVVTPDGKQLTGGSVDFYVNWENNVNVGYGTAIVTAKSGYLVNLTEFRGDYGGSVRVPFRIMPPLATDFRVTEVHETSVSLAWQDSDAVGAYHVYQSENNGDWKKIAESTEGSFEVTDLDPDTSYKFRLRSVTDVDNERFYSIGYSNEVEARTLPKVPVAGDYVVTVSQKSVPYTGDAQTPAVIVTLANGTVVPADTYEVAYENNVNVGTATVTVSGIDGFDGTLTSTFEIVAADISKATVPAIDDQPYSPDPITPQVTVVLGDRTLAEGVDYDVAYKNNQGAGVATITITGKGNYAGEIIREFTILHAATFPDVNDDLWFVAEGYFDYVVDSGIMTGHTAGDLAGMFDPDGELSRGQFSTILYRHANPESEDTTDENQFADSVTFTDVADKAYYTAAIEWCAEKGIVTGYTDPTTGEATGEFGPNDPVTREQLATMIARYAEWTGVDTSEYDPAAFEALPDKGDVSVYAVEPMKWCADQGIITGVYNPYEDASYLMPQGNALRAHITKVITIVARDLGL